MPLIPPPSSAARRLLGAIAESIARGEMRENEPETFLTYAEALKRLGERTPNFKAGVRLKKLGLDELDGWTRAHEALPKVAALIVNKKSRRPSRGLAEAHGLDPEGSEWETWWMAQANRSIRYDWNPYVEGRKVIWVERPPMRAVFAQEDPVASLDVRDLLRWLAAGQTEADILREHPGLSAGEIRSALNWAAGALKPSPEWASEGSKMSSLAERWAGEFELPQAEPGDARLDYLLERYRRHRA